MHEDSSAAPAMNSRRCGLSASRARAPTSLRTAAQLERLADRSRASTAKLARIWRGSRLAPVRGRVSAGLVKAVSRSSGTALGVLGATLRCTRARRPARERSATSSPRPEAPAPPRAANRPGRRAHSQDHARRRATGVVCAPRPTRYVVALPCDRASQGRPRTPMGPIVQPAPVRRREARANVW